MQSLKKGSWVFNILTLLLVDIAGLVETRHTVPINNSLWCCNQTKPCFTDGSIVVTPAFEGPFEVLSTRFIDTNVTLVELRHIETGSTLAVATVYITCSTTQWPKRDEFIASFG